MVHEQSTIEPPQNATILDALPYIDPVSEDYEQYALSLIEDEMKRLPARRKISNANGDSSVSCRNSAAVHEADERVPKIGTKSMAPALSRTTSEIAAPPESDDAQAWRDVVNRARVAYESECLRGIQLEVEKEDGPASSAALWKKYNQSVLEEQHASLQYLLQQQQKTVEEINYCRQQDQQERFGRQLQVLTLQYEELIQKQFHLKQAIADLEEDIAHHRQDQQSLD